MKRIVIVLGLLAGFAPGVFAYGFTSTPASDLTTIQPGPKAQYNSSAPAPSTGTWVSLQADSSGNLKVTSVGSGGGGAFTPTIVYQTTSTVNSSGGFVVDTSTFANVAASATDSSLVSGIPSTVLCVTQIDMVTGASSTNVTLNSKGSGAGTAISPLYAFAANGGIALAYNPTCLFKTNSGESLTVTTGAGATTGIHVKYLKI